MSTKFEHDDFLFGSNAVFIEELYQLYLVDPAKIDPSWSQYFRAFTESDKAKLRSIVKIIGQYEVDPNAKNKNDKSKASADKNSNDYKLKAINSANAQAAQENLKLRAKMMIAAYRNRAHYLAQLDPLRLEKLKNKAELKLDITDFGFKSSELEELIELDEAFDNLSKTSLANLVDLLNKTYANHVAIEFEQVEDLTEKTWLYQQIENSTSIRDLSPELSQDVLKDLIELESFEQYIHTKFPGAKRFSVEGGESSLIALINFIKAAGDAEFKDVIIGMAHRGRLCTLTKVMGKPYQAIFAEFLGASAFPEELEVAGDVKYHMGYSSDMVSPKGNKIHLSLCPNPSHLEAVNPVVAGRTRAKQDLIDDSLRQKVLGIILHGDAAFCGQGIVSECLVMSGLDAYNVGGILHIVINNQIGFTANARDARASRYCTDIAKSIGAPIIHVNGDEVESVLIAARIALDYRIKFGKDIVLDIVCYRKYGHNEGDEPMYTQAEMYNTIKDKISPANIYANALIEKNIVSAKDVDKLKADFKTHLDYAFKEAKTYKPELQWLGGLWHGYNHEYDNTEVVTGVSKDKLKELGLKLCNIPANFNINPKLTKLFELRAKSLNENGPLDWATAEQIAFASLLAENIPIRLTGQDCERGTFSHRHSVLHDQINDQVYLPLNNLSQPQAKYYVADSNLSEYGVLGFEYGYSMVNPKQLVLWEAQFGDFCNGAQIIFDQFIASAETKWLRMSGLVVLLPHAAEGAGPEHSSARLERFLQLAAEDNMQIVYPSSPASIFHLLRRQIYQNTRKPLIVMTPKSLLRHKLAISHLDDLDTGTSFKTIIDEIDSNIESARVDRVIFCTGKIYYDLLEMRTSQNITNTAIVRFEQLYPFKDELVAEIVKKYNKAKKFIWCQEEPKNMGAWSFIEPRLSKILSGAIEYVGIKESASPAAGSLYQHNKAHLRVIKSAFEIN